MDLTQVLAQLRDAGASRAKVEFDAKGGVKALDVEFQDNVSANIAPAGFVDSSGKPIDLNEGAGPLEREEDDEIERSNRQRAEKRAESAKAAVV